VTPVVAVLAISTFLAVLWRLRVVAVASDVLSTTSGAVAVLHDATADDRMREQAMRRASLRLIRHFGSLLMRASVSLAASGVPIVVAAACGLAPARDVVAFLERWQTGLIAFSLALAGYLVRTRPWITT
jgi:hypothetical protein